MTKALTAQNLSEATAQSLSWLSNHGFRYLKTHNHFRRKDRNGFSYITIDSVTHNRLTYRLAFGLGVQITEVEVLILKLMGQTRQVGHHDPTIWNYTVNIGPSSPHWQFPVPGSWTLGALGEFDGISTYVNRFVRELALPFVDNHQDPLAVRRTLIETPGHATNFWPYRQILVIDSIYSSPEQVQADIVHLDERYERYTPELRQEFEEFVSAVRKTINLEQSDKR